MSLNQSKAEKSESHFRKTGRSGNSGNQRSFSGSGGGKGGGGNAPPPQSSSINSSYLPTNRSYKKPTNGQGGQNRVSGINSNSEINPSTARPGQNGAHAQPPLSGVSDAPASGVVAKPTNPSAPRSSRPVPKVPSSQPTAGTSDSVAPSTPAKGDGSQGFTFQFGSISPGFMNGMQIPARTSSAPPNLDEQKRDQARYDSFRAAPTLPIPPASKQQQLPKDAGSIKQSTTVEAHAASQAKRDVHAQVPPAPATTVTQKPSVLPIPGMSMAMPFQSPVPIPFGAPNSQIQSQGVTTTSLQMQMPLSVGNAAQVQQQVFVPGLQSHPLQTQGMIPQSQSLNFGPQIAHQMPPQMGNMGIGIAPQFQQQQAGKFVAPRKAVKITHPDTHEELRLDKRTDSYLDSGSSGPRLHPNVPPQSQPIPSFTPTHQINYYPPMQPNAYNPTSIYYPTTQTGVPLTSAQMTTGSQAPRYSYPVGQGPQSISFKNPSTLNPIPISKNGPPVHSVAEPLKLEHPHDTQAAAASVPLPSVQVTVKPAVVSLGEKVGFSSVTVSSPVISKGESPKLLRPSKEANTFHTQRDNELGSEISIQQSKPLHEPPSSLALHVKYSTAAAATVPVQRLPTSTPTSVSAALSEESASVISNTEGRRRETVKKSDSFKDHQKKLGKKDTRHSQSQNQEDASDTAGISNSSSLRISKDITQRLENMHSPPYMVESAQSALSFPSQSSEHCSLKEGNPLEGKETPALLGSSEGLLESSKETLPDSCVSSDASKPVSDGVRPGDVSCVSSDKLDLQFEGTTPDNLDVSRHAKQNLVEVQLKQEYTGAMEEGKTELTEGTNQGSSNLEMLTESIHSKASEGNKKLGFDSDVKETAVGKETGFVESEQEKNEGPVSCSSSEIDRMTDNMIRSVTTSSGSVDTEPSPSSFVSSTNCNDDKTANVDTSTCKNERTDSEDVTVIGSGTSHQDSLPDSTQDSFDTTLKHEGKGTEITSDGLVSTSLSGSKDKPALDTNRVKSTVARGKKKRKDILKAADAAGSTSDLYMAYKGPEEKQETAVSSESIDSSSSVDVKQTPADDTEKDAITTDEDGQSKAEPDDWEDAADISTPKLETSGIGKQDCVGSVHYDDDGKSSKKYSRDFLLKLSEQCTNLPAGFEIGTDIAEALKSVQVGISHLVDREMYPNSGRIIDRPSGGPRPDRRGMGMGMGIGIADDDKWSKSPGPFATGRDPRLDGGHGGAVVGFRPGQGGNHGVLRNPRGQPSGQYIGGILSGPMQSMASQGGMQWSSSDADRWQRATGFQKGLIPSPHTPAQIMHKAEKKYEIRKVSDKEEAKQRQLKAILNKLTPQNFEKLFEQVKEVNIDNAVTLTGVISQIFDKALMEPTFCEMYANFCFYLARELPDFSEDNEKITFKRLLLNKCQEEFERGEREQAEANRVEEEGEIKCSEEEREEKRVQARRRMLGNIRLIGELYKKKMLTERIMHECIKKLLGQHQNPDEEDIESLCKLMSTIGEMIDHPKAKEHMDAYFDIMTQFSNNMKLSSRVRFMLKDSIDLRRNKWQQRRKVEGPKKIDEVHRDAAQERQAQATRLARGPSISSSARRGQPVDFGPRGSTLFSSPNVQMGGLRGLSPQVRGYAIQDVRMEERHSYESRTLSVPLSQRPLDDGSITLGPQGGLARGMSVRGQPLMPGVPLVDIPTPGDPRRLAAGPNGYGAASEWTPYNAREEVLPRYSSERSMAMPSYDQLNFQERHAYLGNKDLRSADRSLDRSMASSPAQVQGASTVSPAHAGSEKVWPEERLRDMSIAAIREFYSAKDKEEVGLCIKDLNSPNFYPTMVSIWVTDSFERKDLERDLLAKLLVDLTKSRDSLLSQMQLIQGFESVFSTLEDAVNDAPKAAEFLGRILAKVILENVITLREIGRLIHEGGEEPGHLLQMGLASEVLGSILEIIRLEKGESVLNEIRTGSSLRLEDFRPPDPIKSRKLDAFI